MGWLLGRMVARASYYQVIIGQTKIIVQDFDDYAVLYETPFGSRGTWNDPNKYRQMVDAVTHCHGACSNI